MPATETKWLPPGSQEAVEAGCLCPVIDNYYGKGFEYAGKQAWYIAGECPLHVRMSNKKENAEPKETA